MLKTTWYCRLEITFPENSFGRDVSYFNTHLFNLYLAFFIMIKEISFSEKSFCFAKVIFTYQFDRLINVISTSILSYRDILKNKTKTVQQVSWKIHQLSWLHSCISFSKLLGFLSRLLSYKGLFNQGSHLRKNGKSRINLF